MVDEPSEAYHARLVMALSETVFDVSQINMDGKTTAYIRTAEACEALVTVIGMLMEGAPNCQTPQGMRKMAEAVGRNTLAAMKVARTIREANGGSLLGGSRVVIN